MRIGVFLSVIGMILLGFPSMTRAAIEGLERVASGLGAPIFVTHAPGDSSRLFIAQRGGQIRILDLTTGVLQTTPFLRYGYSVYSYVPSERGGFAYG